MKRDARVDELVRVREKIADLKKREKTLVMEISKNMENQGCVFGFYNLAKEIVQTRLGPIDPKALELKGLKVENFRKPSVTVYSLKTEPIEFELHEKQS